MILTRGNPRLEGRKIFKHKARRQGASTQGTLTPTSQGESKQDPPTSQGESKQDPPTDQASSRKKKRRKVDVSEVTTQLKSMNIKSNKQGGRRRSLFNKKRSKKRGYKGKSTGKKRKRRTRKRRRRTKRRRR